MKILCGWIGVALLLACSRQLPPEPQTISLDTCRRHPTPEMEALIHHNRLESEAAIEGAR